MTLITSKDEIPDDAVVAEKIGRGSLAVYHTNPECDHYPEPNRPLTWDDARTTIRECTSCQRLKVPSLD